MLQASRFCKQRSQSKQKTQNHLPLSQHGSKRSVATAGIPPPIRQGRLPRACVHPEAVPHASKRWSALLTQAKSRIGHKCGMRERLGEAHWATFVRYAEGEHKARFFRAFTPASGVLCCEGKLDGTPCPKQVRIDLKRISSMQCGAELAKLHMDHTHDVKRICEVWSAALPKHPQSWDDGICGALVAHLLFGTEDHVLARCSARPIWRKQLIFRCGTVRGVQGQRAEDVCHDLVDAHGEYRLEATDIQWQS